MGANWVDILMVAILLRGIYVGRKSGLIVELFKLLSIFFATFVALHYYIQLGDFFKEKILVPDSIKYVSAFILLTLMITFLFALIREGWLIILKIEPHAVVNRWGGMLVSLIRSYLICGLVLMMLMISAQDSIVEDARGSLSGFLLKGTSISIYQFCYTTLISKYFPDEVINKEVFRLVPNGK